MNKKERNILIISLVFTVFFNELFIFGGFGISVPIYLCIYYLMLFLYCRKTGIKIVLKDNLLFIPIILSALGFVLFDYSRLMVLNILFLWFIVIMNTAGIIKISDKEKYSVKFFIDMFNIGIIYPFKNIEKCFGVIKNQIKGNSKNKLIILGKVIIGLMIGLILLAIVIPLLMSSDAAFYGMMELIVEDLSFNFIFTIIKKIVMFIIIFFPMYSFVYGITHKELKKPENNQEIIYKKSKLDFTIVITFTSVIAAIYLLFCISQFSYFISAFAGILPENYSYSQYARKGFFEAIPLTIINFIFIILLNKLFYQSENNIKKKLIKIYSLFISTISLFIVITALSKLVLYLYYI